MSVLSQEIGWEEHLLNGLCCVEWDVKPSLSQSTAVEACSCDVRVLQLQDSETYEIDDAFTRCVLCGNETPDLYSHMRILHPGCGSMTLLMMIDVSVFHRVTSGRENTEMSRGVFFKDLPEPTRPTAPLPVVSLYGIIYVTWYTGGLPEATGVRLRLPNSHALLGSGRP